LVNSSIAALVRVDLAASRTTSLQAMQKSPVTAAMRVDALL